MSKIQLNSIVANKSISVPDYYIASIVNSESGFLTPRMITSSTDLDAYFGDFKYKQMYKNFIDKGVPSLLIPIITPVSKYNRCSLRLNTIGSSVSHCHPRLGADYELTAYGEVINQSFTDVSEVTIHTNSVVPIPYQVLTYQGVDYKDLAVTNVRARYELIKGQYSIHLSFSESCSGIVIIERIPSIESDSNESGSINLRAGENTFSMSTQMIPEMVVVDHQGNEIEYSVSYNDYDSTITIISNEDAILYYRIIPRARSMMKDIVAESIVLSHNLGYFPLIRTTMSAGSEIELIDVAITHRDLNNVFLQLSDVEGFTIIYNIIYQDNDIDVDKVELGESIFNVLLDFSKVTEEDYIRLIQPNLPPLYFILMINGTKYLFIRYGENYTEQVPTDYYDKRVSIDPMESMDLRGFISQILIHIEDIVSSTNTKTFKKEVISALTTAFSNNKEVRAENDQLFQIWYDELKSSIYSTEFYLGNYRDVINFLDEYLAPNGIDSNATLTDLINLIESNDLFYEPRILVNYSTQSEELNHYYFPGLTIGSSFNHNQDTLCSISEKEKVIEFYAKAKGSAGQNIFITIESDKKHANYYNIRLNSSDYISESYYCYVGYNRLNLDAIDIRSISELSNLVDVILYDYRLPDGTLVDQSDYQFDEYDPTRVIEVKLPEGTYHLARVTQEDWIPQDYKNTLKYLGDTRYYPDFFLCPELIRMDLENNPYTIRDQIEDIKSYVKGSVLIGSDLVDEGKYSQALINLEWQDFENADSISYESEDNRILFTYGNAIQNGYEIPIMYYYVMNILLNDPIRIPTDNLIYDIDTYKVGNAVIYQGSINLIYDKLGEYYKLKSPSGRDSLVSIDELSPIMNLLNEKDVNYLSYNNLYYYYHGLLEDVSQISTFYIQYHASKIAREFYKIKSKLVASTPYSRLKEVSDMTTKLLVLLTHLKSLDAELIEDGRSLRIQINASMKSLINKLFDINYILNIS